jgi:hypothetical protein
VLRVDDLDAHDGLQVRRVGPGIVGQVAHAPDRGGDVLGLDRRPVVEARLGPEVELPRAVVDGAPRRGEVGHHLRVGAHLGQRREQVLVDRHVGVEEQEMRVDRGIALHAHPQLLRERTRGQRREGEREHKRHGPELRASLRHRFLPQATGARASRAQVTIHMCIVCRRPAKVEKKEAAGGVRRGSRNGAMAAGSAPPLAAE